MNQLKSSGKKTFKNKLLFNDEADDDDEDTETSLDPMDEDDDDDDNSDNTGEDNDDDDEEEDDDDESLFETVRKQKKKRFSYSAPSPSKTPSKRFKRDDQSPTTYKLSDSYLKGNNVKQEPNNNHHHHHNGNSIKLEPIGHDSSSSGTTTRGLLLSRSNSKSNKSTISNSRSSSRWCR